MYVRIVNDNDRCALLPHRSDALLDYSWRILLALIPHGPNDLGIRQSHTGLLCGGGEILCEICDDMANVLVAALK